MDSANSRINRAMRSVAARMGLANQEAKRSYTEGVDSLQWIGLVASTLPANHDELASLSLTGDHSGEDPANWIA